MHHQNIMKADDGRSMIIVQGVSHGLVEMSIIANVNLLDNAVV
jgi:hypothetical protein